MLQQHLSHHAASLSPWNASWKTVCTKLFWSSLFCEFWVKSMQDLHARYFNFLRLYIAPKILLDWSSSLPFDVTPLSLLDVDFLFAWAFRIFKSSFAPSLLPTSSLQRHWISIAAGCRRLLWCFIRFISWACNISLWQLDSILTLLRPVGRDRHQQCHWEGWRRSCRRQCSRRQRASLPKWPEWCRRTRCCRRWWRPTTGRPPCLQSLSRCPSAAR